MMSLTSLAVLAACATQAQVNDLQAQIDQLKSQLPTAAGYVTPDQLNSAVAADATDDAGALTDLETRVTALEGAAPSIRIWGVGTAHDPSFEIYTLDNSGHSWTGADSNDFKVTSKFVEPCIRYAYLAIRVGLDLRDEEHQSYWGLAVSTGVGVWWQDPRDAAANGDGPDIYVDASATFDPEVYYNYNVGAGNTVYAWVRADNQQVWLTNLGQPGYAPTSISVYQIGCID